MAPLRERLPEGCMPILNHLFCNCREDTPHAIAKLTYSYFLLLGLSYFEIQEAPSLKTVDLCKPSINAQI